MLIGSQRNTPTKPPRGDILNHLFREARLMRRVKVFSILYEKDIFCDISILEEKDYRRSLTNVFGMLDRDLERQDVHVLFLYMA